jgi:hypothetical protein
MLENNCRNFINTNKRKFRLSLNNLFIEGVLYMEHIYRKLWLTKRRARSTSCPAAAGCDRSPLGIGEPSCRRVDDEFIFLLLRRDEEVGGFARM